MANKSNITWTDATWNPWMGCTKVSQGCKNCYMHRILQNKGNQVVKTKQMRAPYNWKKGKYIFTCSMSDFFIEEADSLRNDAWKVIKNTQHHTYLILTKRPERILECLPKDWSQKNYSNVWLGVSVEEQENTNRIEQLGKIPCQLRWVSFEPLLEEVYLKQGEIDIIDWAVIGGESGHEDGKFTYRKSNLSWFLSLMYQFRNNQKPIFFKQFGSWYHKNQFFLKDWKGEKWCANFPNEFKVRQIPNNSHGE